MAGRVIHNFFWAAFEVNTQISYSRLFCAAWKRQSVVVSHRVAASRRRAAAANCSRRQHAFLREKTQSFTQKPQ